MKKTIYLNESDGYEPNSKCRREKVFGRLEFLKAFFDGPPFWMIRLRGRTTADRELLARHGSTPWGNGHWRFTALAAAEKRFSELCAIPEYALDEENRVKLQGRRREAFLKVKVPIKPKSNLGTGGK